MKVLTINWAVEGTSTGYIIQDIQNELQKRKVEFVHFYEYYKKARVKGAYRLSNWFTYRVQYWITHLTGDQYGTPSWSTLKLLGALVLERPDVVHIHCPNAYTLDLFAILQFLKLKKIPTVITNHAQFFYTGNCAHAGECRQYMSGCMICSEYRKKTSAHKMSQIQKSWLQMKKVFERNECVTLVAVSEWEEQRIKEATITKGIPTKCIWNGIDTATFCYNEDSLYVYQKYGLPMKKFFLHVTSNFSPNDRDTKGGWYILELAQILKSKKCEIPIVVVGNCTECEGTNFSGLNIRLIGLINNRSDMAALYSMATCMVLTSKYETFGMTCAESLCCGTQIVGFRNGGSNTIAMGEYSKFVEFGEVDELADLLIQQADSPYLKIKQTISDEAIKLYSKQRMADQYYDLYRMVSNE